MNKLEKLHLDAILEECFNEWTTWKEEEIAAKNFAAITKNIAIKFAFWVDSSSFTYSDEEDIWYNITEEKKTGEELFEMFMNKFYE